MSVPRQSTSARSRARTVLLYDVGAVEAVVHELTGTVFEDADFAGTATRRRRR